MRVTVTVSGTLSLNIKAARLTFTGIGLVWRIPIGEDGEAIDDPIDVKIPDGVAVALNAPSISGGGFLQRIEAPDGRVTWRGGLALRFADSFELAAFAVIELGGNRPYTLLLFVTVRFTPPYPLAFGLKLTTVGGLLALNRTMDVDALRDAVLGTPGALDTALFSQRPEEQLPVVLPTIERFFPAAPGHQVAGLLVEIEWRAETGTLFGHFRGVLLAELENFVFALYGTAQVGFPTLTQDHILRLRAGLEAVYDYRNKFVRVSLALTEALLFKRVRLTGGAALMFRWGEHDEFAFTLGGFHPSFRPFIPAGLREPPRLGATWHPNEFVDLNLQSYFAITSTSLQYGWSAHVEIGASWGGLRADADFNFLVMRKPRTLFEVDLQFRVTAHLFGCDLFSAGLKGSMTGPDPWVIEGTIYWEVCGVDMSKDFGPYQWGDDLGQIGQTQEQARRVIGDAVADPASWSMRRQTALAVRLRPGANDALDPRDQIDVRQTQLPLGIALEVYDASGLSDAGAWRLVGTGGVAKLSDLTDVFPTRRYLRKPPKEQPFRGGLASGARFGSTAWSVPAGAVASDESLTEDRVLDSLTVPPPQPATGHPLNVALPLRRGDPVRRAVAGGRAEVDAARGGAGGDDGVNLFFLPFVRQGLTPVANAGARANVSVSFRLEAAGQPSRDISRTLALAGPGDVLAIEPRQVLRVSPAAGARDAEPDFFPLIEFDAPELPWAYSPTVPAGSRLLPWLVLVVIEADPSVRLERGAQGQSPWILQPARRSRAAGTARPRRCGHVGARADRVRHGRPDCRHAGRAARPHAVAAPGAAPPAAESRLHRGGGARVSLRPHRRPGRRPHRPSGARHRTRARVECARHADATARVLHVELPHRRGRRLRVAGAAAARRAAGPRRRAHGAAPVAAQRHRRVGRRLGSAAARAGAGGASAAASHRRRQRDPHGAARRHEPADPRAVVLRRAVDGRTRADAHRGVGAGSEPDAGAARGRRPGRGRRAGRAGRAGRGRAGAARRVHGGAARGAPAATGHRVRQPGRAAAGGRAHQRTPARRRRRWPCASGRRATSAPTPWQAGGSCARPGWPCRDRDLSPRMRVPGPRSLRRSTWRRSSCDSRPCRRPRRPRRTRPPFRRAPSRRASRGR